MRLYGATAGQALLSFIGPKQKQYTDELLLSGVLLGTYGNLVGKEGLEPPTSCL